MIRLIFALLIAAFLLPQNVSAAKMLDLSGIWTIETDSTDNGLTRGNENRDFVQTIELPGTLDIAHIGTPNALKPEMGKPQLLHLTRRFSYVGPAWYTRTIEITAEMAGKPLEAMLERVLWSSEMWVDGVKVADVNESLTTPHRFIIPEGLSEGEHRLTLRIDNRKRYDISVDDMAHAYTNETQTIWNGALGRMELRVLPEVRIESVKVYPNITGGSVKVIAKINNCGKGARREQVRFSISSDDSDSTLAEWSERVDLSHGVNRIEATLQPENAPELWSEFTPTLYRACVEAGEDSATETFGMREISTEGKRLMINGHPAFLLGTLECCVFPLTGTPSTSTRGWTKVMETAKAWGLNHLRFHSWCPPEAAFRVADSLGLYLQIELPFWSTSLKQEDAAVKAFLREEATRILDEYGNHPSFCLLSNGNELQKDFDWLNETTALLKESDPRRLYTTSTFTFESGHGLKPEPADDFFVTQWTADGWVRGQGVFDSEPPTFNRNYAPAMVNVDRPLIQHESGQYAVYPSIREIEKYTGTLEPLNLKAIKEDLRQKGLLHLADTFTLASGRFAALLYKEEIERAMKTPGFSGYQLLGLQDFPGQGTALVGLVDAFWDSKGVATPDEFRRFAAPVVPLAEFDKAVYSGKERFCADVELLNFSDKRIENAIVNWTISSGNTILYAGSNMVAELPIGEIGKAARVDVGLDLLDKPAQLKFEARVANTPYSNSWSVWYYPEIAEVEAGEVVETSELNTAIAALQSGKKVLYSPRPDSIKGLECKFLPVFWSPVHFPKQASGMGIYTNPKHQAFASFPTEMHTDWQWWYLLKHAVTLNLDSLSSGRNASERLMPIVGMIDNFANNRNLGLIAEAKCGNGLLIISSIDLLSPLTEDRAEIKWLRQSLLDYMNSEAFDPKTRINPEALKALQSPHTNIRTTAESIYD